MLHYITLDALSPRLFKRMTHHQLLLVVRGRACLMAVSPVQCREFVVCAHSWVLDVYTEVSIRIDHEAQVVLHCFANGGNAGHIALTLALTLLTQVTYAIPNTRTLTASLVVLVLLSI